MTDYKHNITPVYVGQRIIGRVSGQTFQKVIKGSLHLLKKPPAIAFDLSTLTQAEQAGAVNVQVTDSETGIIYRATIEHIKNAGFELNRGFGAQVALPLEGWTKTSHGRFTPEQLSLFSQVGK